VVLAHVLPVTINFFLLKPKLLLIFEIGLVVYQLPDFLIWTWF